MDSKKEEEGGETSSSKKTTPVMYNARFGSFSFSSEAIAEYNIRKPSDVPPIRMSTCVDIDRTDSIMAQICREMGPKANGMFSKIQIEDVPVRFSECYAIREFDGLETVCISLRKYQLECILRILDTITMSNDEKIKMIKLVFSEENQLPSNLHNEDDNDGSGFLTKKYNK